MPGKKKCPAASTAVLHPQPAELPMLSRVLRSLIPAYHLFALHPSLSPSRVYSNQLSVRSKSTQFPCSFVSSSARSQPGSGLHILGKDLRLACHRKRGNINLGWFVTTSYPSLIFQIIIIYACIIRGEGDFFSIDRQTAGKK